MTDDLMLRFWAKVKPSNETDCWEWTGAKSEGYGQILVGKKVRFAHRISYELAKGPIPIGLQVCHHCDNPPCILPSHLFLGTAKDNKADAQQKGRLPRGATHGMARLSFEQVMVIKATPRRLDSCRVLSERFGVSRDAVRDVYVGRSWSHL